MPNRILKPGICDSETIDACTPEEEVFYYRLLVNVDDFGRMDARNPVIRAKCFPLKNYGLPEINKLLVALHNKGLIILYYSDGCTYLQITKWDNVPRAKYSKHPAPENICNHLQADAERLQTNAPLTVTVTETKTDTPFEEFWTAYPKKTGKGAAQASWNKKKPDLQIVLDALAWQTKTDQWTKDKGQYIPNPSTWLNQERWLDENPAAKPFDLRRWELEVQGLI